MPESSETHDARLPTPRPQSGDPTPIVPGYEIGGVLGRGGMGVVYRATQTRLGRPVALKVVLSGPHLSDRERVRFEAEARALATLNHPNVVTIFDFGEENSLPWYALEYCPGGTLADRLRASPMSPSEAASVVAILARAVDAVHRRGLIHRDLKPANVLFAEDGVPKVADFGLARDGDGQSTSSGVALGTPAYMAPEQARGEKVDRRVDVYALGAILYQCLTGRPPYQGPSWLVVASVAGGQTSVSPVREVNPTVPEWLATVCERAMSRDADRRHATAAELAAALVAPPSHLAPLAPARPKRPQLLTIPFSAARAWATQEAWAAHFGSRGIEQDIVLGGERLTVVLIPPGCFLMGPTEADDPHDSARFRVTISRPFWLGKFPVTQAQYRAVTGESPSYFSATGHGKDSVAGMDTSRFPVESVSWGDAVAFCELARLEARRRITLPTEAQWEWACRAGTRTRYYFGDDPDALDRFAWFGRNAGGRTRPVREKQSNGFGLFDMLGNVWEWCSDWREGYPDGELVDPVGTLNHMNRGVRGGSWESEGLSGSAESTSALPLSTDRDLGFRIAIEAGD